MSLPRCRCGELTSGHLGGIGPRTRNLEGILIPGDGAARDQGAQNRPACAAIAAKRRLRHVPSQRFLALWCQAHTPSCSRQVTSTLIRMVKPGPASAPRGHAPLRTDTLSLARTISDRCSYVCQGDRMTFRWPPFWGCGWYSDRSIAGLRTRQGWAAPGGARRLLLGHAQ
jgi:hypothetical protein